MMKFNGLRDMKDFIALFTVENYILTANGVSLRRKGHIFGTHDPIWQRFLNFSIRGILFDDHFYRGIPTSFSFFGLFSFFFIYVEIKINVK